MNTTFPYNRLQMELRNRQRQVLLFVGMLITIVAFATIMIKPALADPPPNANPSGLSDSAIASIVSTVRSTNVCDTSTCPYWYYFNGIGLSGEETCVHVTDVDTFAVDTQNDTLGFSIGGGFNHPYCWNGAAWYDASFLLLRVATTHGVLDNVIASPINLYARLASPAETCPADAGNTTWNMSAYSMGTKHTCDLFVTANFSGGAPAIPAANLTYTPVTNISIDDDITFEASWNHLTEDIQNIYFYPNGRETGSCALSGCTPNQLNYVQVASGVPINNGTTGSGAWAFVEHYHYGATYHPKVLLSPTCSILQINTQYDDCNVTEVETTVTVNGPADQDSVYDVSLHFPYQNSGGLLYVDEPAHYVWKVDPALCTDNSSTVASKVFYKGYPSSVADSGSTLTGNSGTGTTVFPYRSDQFNNDIIPYIKVTCNNGDYAKIYNGDSLYASRAGAELVVSRDFNLFWGKQDFTQGGESTDYSAATGSGAYFFSDKHFYDVNEPVLLKFYYDVPFTVGSTVLFKDNSTGLNIGLGSAPDTPKSSPTGGITITGSAADERVEHRQIVRYGAPFTLYPSGVDPVLLVKSNAYNASDPSTYRIIYLGGNAKRDPQKFIVIKLSTVFNNPNGTIFGSNSSNGTLTGGTLNLSTDGIFGMDPSVFKVSFGAQDNQLLVWAQDLVNIVIRAALWVASSAWNILKSSPIFSFIDSSFHPKSGSTHILPPRILNQPVAFIPADANFTISYANAQDSRALIWFINLFLLGAMMKFILTAIF